jgi:hypothetical protein
MSTYYDLLEQIRRKPGLYLGSPSISNLYMFLHGYQFAHRQLGVSSSAQEQQFQKFQPWLQQKFGIKTSQSWSQLILFHARDEQDAFERFFELFQEFTQSQSEQPSVTPTEPQMELA